MPTKDSTIEERLSSVEEYVRDLKLMFQARSLRLTLVVHDDLRAEPPERQAEVLDAFCRQMHKRRVDKHYVSWKEIDAFWKLFDLPVPNLPDKDGAWPESDYLRDGVKSVSQT